MRKIFGKKSLLMVLLCLGMLLLFAAPALAVDELYTLELETEEDNVLKVGETGELTITYQGGDSVAENVYLTLTAEADNGYAAVQFYANKDANDEITECQISQGNNNVTVYIKASMQEIKDKVTITAEDGSGGIGRIVFDVERPYLADLDIVVDDEILVNDRAEVTINLLDQWRNAYIVPESVQEIIIGLDCLNIVDGTKGGAFFAHLFGGNQEANWKKFRYGQAAIKKVSIGEGESSVTIYFQPDPIWWESSDMNGELIFTYENGSTGQPAEKSSPITVKPAGSSYAYIWWYDSENDEEEWGYVPHQEVGKPLEVVVRLYDQYGNYQYSDGKTKVILTAEGIKGTGDLKFYSNSACIEEIEDGILIIPEGETHQHIYLKATKALEYEVTCNIEGSTWYDWGTVHFYPGPALSMKMATTDSDGYIKIWNGESLGKSNSSQWTVIKINAYDEYDNLTWFRDPGLTAQLTSTIGKFYDDDGDIITQFPIEKGEFGYRYAPVKFASMEAGEAEISAKVPGIDVEPVTIIVADALPAELKIRNVPNFAYPGEEVALAVQLLNDDGTTAWDKEVNILVTLDGKEIYQETVTIGEKGKFDYIHFKGERFCFTVPDDSSIDYTQGIQVKATFGTLERTEKILVADVTAKLYKGWNLFSTPYRLENARLDDVVADPDAIEIAYGYRDGEWYQLTGDDAMLIPLNAYYIKMKEDSWAKILGKRDVPSAPPVKELNTGWNLIGQAYDVVNGMEEMPIEEAFQNLIDFNFNLQEEILDIKFNILISPGINQQVPWVLTLNGFLGGSYDLPDLEYLTIRAFEGYWIHMTEEGYLTGFSWTPVQHLE
jgi:hypothetical protein